MRESNCDIRTGNEGEGGHATPAIERDDCDTTAIAVSALEFWWRSYIARMYPHATRILIVSNSGESNGAQSRLWKLEMQKLADSLELPISFCHKPPVTSRWRRVQNQLHSTARTVTEGQLVEHDVLLSLVGRMPSVPATEEGVRSELVTESKISDEVLFSVNLERNSFHGQWNFAIYPRKTKLSPKHC